MDSDEDLELVAMTQAIMFSSHGQVISDEQARGIITLILAGREVANPSAYVRHALAQADGGRYSSGPTPAPGELDLITLRKSQLLRDADPAVVAEYAARAHRGADLCRQMLADRPRPEVSHAAPGGELHGAALAAEQAAQSRALRARLPEPPAVEDVPLPEDGAIADARATREHMKRWADGAEEHPGEADETDTDDDDFEPPF